MPKTLPIAPVRSAVLEPHFSALTTAGICFSARAAAGDQTA